MKSINGILYFEVSDLMEGYGVPENTVKNACKRNREGSRSWINIPDPSDSRKKLVQCDSIPAATVEKYGIPKVEKLWEEYREQTEDDRAIKLTQLALQMFRKSDVDHYLGRSLSREKSRSLADAASWLRLLSEIRGKTQVRQMEIPGVSTKEELTVAVLEKLKAMEDTPEGLDKVSSLQVLKRKLSAFNKARKISEEDALDTIPHRHTKLKGKRDGNQGRRKINDQVREVLLSMYMGAGTDVKLKPDQIYATYNAAVLSGRSWVDKQTGTVYENLPELGLTTVRTFLRRKEVAVLDKYRHGTQYAKDTMRPYILRKKPKYSFSFSSSDGTSMPFWLKVKGKNTWKRGTAYLIFDVHSSAIIGAALGKEENREVMTSAFYNLYCRHDGRMPLDNQLDNFAKFFQSDLEQIMGVRFCEPYHGQSKYAEGYINTFKYSVLNTFEGFIGRHSLNNPNNKRNPDKEPVHYTMEELAEILDRAVEQYNSLPWKKGSSISKAEALAMNINPESEAIREEQAAASFGIRRAQSIDRGYVILSHRKEEYAFELPDYEQLIPELKNGKRVRVRFLPHLLEDKIWVYNYDSSDDPEKDSLLCVASYQGGTQAAPAEQTEEDKQNLARQMARRGGFDQMVEEMHESLPAFLISDGDRPLGMGYTSKAEIQAANEVAEIPVIPTKKKDDKDDEIHKRFM